MVGKIRKEGKRREMKEGEGDKTKKKKRGSKGERGGKGQTKKESGNITR